jgi:hypothetical protein
MTRQLLPKAVLSLLAATAACDDLLGPEPNPSFRASPDTVVAGDTVRVTFTFRNGMPYPVTIRSSSTCLFVLIALLRDEPAPWRGTNYACGAAITDFVIPPRDSIHEVHTLVAAREAFDPGPPLPAGTYRIVARMHTAMPDLETEVTLLAPSRSAPPLRR